MYDIDVNGTQAVLQAAADAGVKQVIQTSSATAYGAFPDNPKPIAEDWPVRGAPDFSYAKHKADSDRIAQLWALENPDAVMTIVRPSIVFGPSVDNYIVRAFGNNPFVPTPRWSRRGVPARPRGRRRLGADRSARRQARGRVQPGRRRPTHLGSRRGAGRQEDAEHLAEDDEARQRRDVEAPRAPDRGARRQPRLHPLPVGRLHGEAQVDRGLAAASTTRSRPSRSPCGPRACCPRRPPPFRHRRRPSRNARVFGGIAERSP